MLCVLVFLFYLFFLSLRLCSCLSQILNFLYSKVVYRLNDFENHRTDTDYEDNLVAKVFVFQLVNSFAAVTYVAFVKSFIGILCSGNNCTQDVAGILSTVFLTRLVLQLVTNVFLRKVTLSFLLECLCVCIISMCVSMCNSLQENVSL